MTAKEKKLHDLTLDLLKGFIGEAQSTVNRAENQIASFMTRLADHGNVSREEAGKVAGETIKRLRKNRGEVTRYFDARLEKMAKVMAIPSRTEVEGLKERVEKLSRRIDRMSKKIA